MVAAGDHAAALAQLRQWSAWIRRELRIGRLLSAAAAAAGGDAGALSSVRAIEGMFLADRGAHGRALRVLRESVHLAESTGHTRQAAWSLSIASRSLLQQGELDGAAEHAEQCLQLAVEERWTAMLPWMEAILADLDLANGRVGQAERRLRHAWSLGLVLNDWCWQAMAARGLGLAAFARGDLPGALRWLEEAGRRAAHDHDRYAWIHAWTQEATCRVTVARPASARQGRRQPAGGPGGRLPAAGVRRPREPAPGGAGRILCPVRRRSRALVGWRLSRPGGGRCGGGRRG